MQNISQIISTCGCWAWLMAGLVCNWLLGRPNHLPDRQHESDWSRLAASKRSMKRAVPTKILPKQGIVVPSLVQGLRNKSVPNFLCNPSSMHFVQSRGSSSVTLGHGNLSFSVVRAGVCAGGTWVDLRALPCLA